MTDQYTVTPTASSTMVFSVGQGGIVSGLRGVNTQACVVGGHANRFDMLLLVEFHPGGLYPFLPMGQSQLVDSGVAMQDVDAHLDRGVREALEAEASVPRLLNRLNALFLAQLETAGQSPALAEAMETLLASRGTAASKALASQTHYSEKHLSRLFKQQVGIGIKTFGRIVRVNHAMRLMETGHLAETAQLAGYFDQSHFIRDFTALCGLSPTAYLKKRSIFYNDTFKM